MAKKENKRLKSKISTYDPKDAQVYLGLKVAEEFLGEKNPLMATYIKDRRDHIQIDIEKID